MPELPEMETYRRLLWPKIGVMAIHQVEVHREKSINTTVAGFRQEMEGRSISAVHRRAKYLQMELDSGKVLLLHLMLGGSLYFGEIGEQPDRTAQVVLGFAPGALYFHGLRLGFLHLLDRFEVAERLAPLGPEPLSPDLSFEQFLAQISRRKGMLKPILVDQHVVSGIGNCYSDEICFHAGILPFQKMGNLDLASTRRLYDALQFVLTDAIRWGGYMDSPLFAEDKVTGGYNARLAVYDRENESCRRCGHPVLKRVISSRKTFFCAVCQQ